MKYIPTLVAISLSLLFISYLIMDAALAHRGSGRDKFRFYIAEIMPGDGRREDDGDQS